MAASTAPPRPGLPGPGERVVPGPFRPHGHVVWAEARETAAGLVQVRFVGRSGDRELDVRGDRGEILARAEGLAMDDARPVARVHQVHGARVVPACPSGGPSGDADALWTAEPGLVVSVITADCVPVLLAADGGAAVAAVHAGWRGIVAGVVPKTVEALRTHTGTAPESLHAWVGPSIGVCCYEVSDPVARQVAEAAGTGDVVTTPPGGRPHLDLVGGVSRQLAAAGVPAPTVVVRCTRCDEERLWSYRREGKKAGRNVAYVWREV